MLKDITPLILTRNEAMNIRRTLVRLAWANDVVVVDSFSTDETLAISREFPQVRTVQRTFDTHAEQWNFGLAQTRTTWVLSLDADYVLPEAFADELKALDLSNAFSAYLSSFRFCICGRPIKGNLYPPRAVLFRKDCCHYIQDGHTQRLQIKGPTSILKTKIDHDDRKPFSHWLRAQDRYATLDVEKLRALPSNELRLQDQLRKTIILAPPFVFFYTLFGKCLILDGWPGWFYVFQRTIAELILASKLLEEKLNHQKVGADRL